MGRRELWFSLAVLLPSLAATIAPMSAVDLAYQVRAGELMLASGTILRADPFTFTAMGEPWLNQQWGAGVVFALVQGLLGWGGLVVLRVALVAAAVGLVAAAAGRWLPSRTAALLALAAFAVAIASLGLRAQLFGIALFAAVLAILAWRDRRPGLVWLIPVLVLAWANLHGSFFLGPVAVAVAIADDRVAGRPGVRRLLIVLGVSLGASCVTPFGPAVWPYALGIATNAEITRYITEWQRTSPLTFTGLLFYLSVAGAAALLWLARGRAAFPPWPTLAWLGGLAALGVYAERGVAWWALGAAVALAPVVGAVLEAALASLGPSSRPPVMTGSPPGAATPPTPGSSIPEPRRLRRLNLAVVGVLALAVVALQPLWRGDDPMTGSTGLLRDAPGGVGSALARRAGPEDRVVVAQPWASWIEWAAPGVPVMVDSRVEVVPSSAWADYTTIVGGGPESLEALDRVRATIIVVDPESQSALNVTLRTIGSGWRLAHEDEDGLVYIREE